MRKFILLSLLLSAGSGSTIMCSGGAGNSTSATATYATPNTDPRFFGPFPFPAIL